MTFFSKHFNDPYYPSFPSLPLWSNVALAIGPEWSHVSKDLVINIMITVTSNTDLLNVKCSIVYQVNCTTSLCHVMLLWINVLC